MASNSAQSTLHNVQVARFFAAATVVIGHLQHEFLRSGALSPDSLLAWEPIDWGFGVDMFFVISGFIMYLIAADSFGSAKSARNFLKRRFVRIVPLYWLMTSLMLGIVLLAPGLVQHGEITWPGIIASYLFIPWPRSDGELFPILALGYTLNYEIFFYLMFAIALLFSRRTGMLFLFCAFGLVLLARPLAPPDWWPIMFWGNPIIFEFMFGILLAHARLRGIRLPSHLALAIGCIGVASLIIAHWDTSAEFYAIRVIYNGLPAAAIVAAAVLGPEPKRVGPVGRLLKAGGDASYSLYLSHPFVFRVISLVWKQIGVTSPALVMLTSALLIFLVSYAVYRWGERPIIAALRTGLPREKKVAVSMAP